MLLLLCRHKSARHIYRKPIECFFSGDATERHQKISATLYGTTIECLFSRDAPELRNNCTNKQTAGNNDTWTLPRSQHSESNYLGNVTLNGFRPSRLESWGCVGGLCPPLIPILCIGRTPGGGFSTTYIYLVFEGMCIERPPGAPVDRASVVGCRCLRKI